MSNLRGKSVLFAALLAGLATLWFLRGGTNRSLSHAEMEENAAVRAPSPGKAEQTLTLQTPSGSPGSIPAARTAPGESSEPAAERRTKCNDPPRDAEPWTIALH